MQKEAYENVNRYCKQIIHLASSGFLVMLRGCVP